MTPLTKDPKLRFAHAVEAARGEHLSALSISAPGNLVTPNSSA
jgi:hypothetical protein